MQLMTATAKICLNQSALLMSDNGKIGVMSQAKFYRIKASPLIPRGLIDIVRLDFEVAKGQWWGGAETSAIAAVSAYFNFPLEQLSTSRTPDGKVVSVHFPQEA